MLKFLVDESSGINLFRFLKHIGYDTKYVGEVMVGASDKQVLEFAEREKRILITNDKDFGELIFKLKMISSGVILLRLGKDSQETRKRYILYLINKFGDKLSSNFTVIEEKQVRFRKLE